MAGQEYLVDGESVSWIDLINMASEADAAFGLDGFKSTSGAARILRGLGRSVEPNAAQTKEGE
jgi:hypothetical protein